MRPVVLTSCMAMRMSEAPHLSAPKHPALAHAGEVAQWSLMLLGWLWLGELGMRLGWSLASGVWVVALWWAARLLCRGSRWAFQSSPSTMAWCGGLSALGVWLPEGLAALHGLSADGNTFNTGPLNPALVGSGLVALLWGAWSGGVETRSRVSTFELGPVAWHPVLAAALVALAWRVSAGGLLANWAVSGLLALCAAVLYAREQTTAAGPASCRGLHASGSSILHPSAMGLMMGGLGLGSAWCAGWGWSTEEMVFGHLGMMAGLPALLALASRMWTARATAASASLANRHAHLYRPAHPDVGLHLSLALLALGALMPWGQTAAHALLAMLLPSLAWAIHCSRPRITTGLTTKTSPWLMRCMALSLGPGLLIWVGVASPMLGPVAMSSALAGLGILAGLQLLVLSLHPPVAHPSWSGS